MNIAFFNDPTLTQIETVRYQTLDNRLIQLQIKRDDLIDCSISGNKWRKLKYNFLHAKKRGFSGIASFGGAFSNHIAALAAAGKRSGCQTIGFIRTHKLDEYNPTLRFANECGMRLIALSREQYRRRHDEAFLFDLQRQYPEYFFVPEGGSNDFALQGVAELAAEITAQAEFETIALPIGSGGTAVGLAQNLPSKNILAIGAVNDEALFKTILQQCSNMTIDRSSLFGGYGKTTPELIDFCLDFFSQTGVPIEPVYSGKLLFALVYGGTLSAEQLDKTLVIHTGGLQGLQGMAYRGLINQHEWQDVFEHLGFTKS